MIYQLVVPKAVPDVEEIRVLEWHGAPGDRFEVGDLVVELETHKAVVEVRAGQAGFLRQLLAEEGTWLGIGLPVAMLSDTPDEPVPELQAGSAEMPVTFEVT